MVIMRTKARHDDTMISVETTPAIIDFARVLEATEAVPDESFCETPWGINMLEHEATPVAGYCKDIHPGLRESSGYAWDGRRSWIIELPEGEDYGIYEYLRNRGASKQVAAEAAAAERRRIIDLLVDWYSNGWQWYCVQCSFEVLGEEYGASVGGFLDEEFAGENFVDIALDVAGQLERDGYTVVNKPADEGERALSAKHFTKCVSIDGIKEGWFHVCKLPKAWKDGWKRQLLEQSWREK